jgi:hypothetical protein
MILVANNNNNNMKKANIIVRIVSMKIMKEWKIMMAKK